MPVKELSPAALTVWSAFLDHYEWEVTQTELRAVAAALRAAADQVAIKLAGLGQESAWYLEEIATELETQ